MVTATAPQMSSINASMLSPARLLTQVQTLRNTVYDNGQALYARWCPQITRRAFRLGALNLAYYLALREHDLRPLQMQLSQYGLSSLGRSEARVLTSLEAVTATLAAISGTSTAPKYPQARHFTRGTRLLHEATAEIFGVPPADQARQVRVMVTLPSDAAHDAELVYALTAAGMDVARINCAHDTPDDWAAMIRHIRHAEQATGRQVKVHMDLGGPKPRTADGVFPHKRVFVDDVILLRKDAPQSHEDYPNQVRCTLPEVIDQVQVGHSVWINDGKIGTRVEARLGDALVLRVTSARDRGEKIKNEKGLNFPDTALTLDALTPEDIEALDFVAVHADMIGYSFVQTAADVRLLQAELAKRLDHPERQAIIAKIETHRAIHNLPEIIIAAAGVQPFGVMIARGDLAVEVGYERMAEIQEELLWLCEAAHIPVIWATQVLESFVKDGTPTRGEMTDAAMAVRAECVMLNKGAHVVEAITILNNLMGRMQQHQTKKTPQLRALKAWADILAH